MSFKVDSSTIIDNNQDFTFQGGTFSGTLTSNGGFSWGDVPVGIMHWYPRTDLIATIPTGWVECNGAAISRTTYAALFAVIGTTYGAGNGSTTFNVPNTQDRYIMGDLSGDRGSETGPFLANHTHTTGTFNTGNQTNHTHLATSGNSNSPHSHNENNAGAVNAPHNHNAAVTAGNMPHSHNGNTSNNGSHKHNIGFNNIAKIDTSPITNQNYVLKSPSVLVPNVNLSDATNPVGNHTHTVNSTGANAPHSHNISWGGNAPHSHNANTNTGNGPHSHNLSVSAANVPHAHNISGTVQHPASTNTNSVQLHRLHMRLIIKVT
jgi:microcystin-dependent protein|tara:strand:+ start:2535 stop:3494 length:960 start_codon:yes stop_codon:yes gene_type:complete